MKNVMSCILLCLYIVNMLKFWMRGKQLFHWGRNIQTLPRVHKCVVPPLMVIYLFIYLFMVYLGTLSVVQTA
jgi:hypothetical protein